ncbi:MAG: FAD:protein FMN transferase [Candidatus Marinimicrobia bacterium]|nr:FAD:protein FMN transferase [Candidatus Neomarinimicrobiota bacterium]
MSGVSGKFQGVNPNQLFSYYPSWFLATFFSLLVLVSCSSNQQPFNFTRFAMDTVIDYTIFAENRESARASMLAAQEEIERISVLLWEENQGSEIYRFNYANDSIHTTDEVYNLLARAKEYYETSVSTFDISIKPVLDLYNLTADNPEPPAKETIEQSLKIVGFSYVSLRQENEKFLLEKEKSGVRLAVGGIAKGYAVDRAIDILKEQGIEDALINAGGDLYCLGMKNSQPWKVGIQDPRKTNDLAEVLNISGGNAVATSGDYQRYYIYDGVRYHHILNPETGLPTRKSLSATIVAESPEQADAYATALFILGPIDGMRWVNNLPNVEGMVIDSSGTTYYSDGVTAFLGE